MAEGCQGWLQQLKDSREDEGLGLGSALQNMTEVTRLLKYYKTIRIGPSECHYITLHRRHSVVGYSELLSAVSLLRSDATCFLFVAGECWSAVQCSGKLYREVSYGSTWKVFWCKLYKLMKFALCKFYTSCRKMHLRHVPQIYITIIRWT